MNHSRIHAARKLLNLANDIKLALGLEGKSDAFDHRCGLKVLELGLQLVVFDVSEDLLLPIG